MRASSDTRPRQAAKVRQESGEVEGEREREIERR